MDEKIIFRAGEHTGKEFTIDANELALGRDLDCDVVFEDVQISRRHARIYRQADAFFIEDLKSTNGTLLNGKALKKPQKMKSGDILTFGEHNIAEIYIPYTPGLSVQDDEIIPVGKGVEVELDEEMMPEQPAGALPASVKLLDKYPVWAVVLMLGIGFLILFCLIPFVIIEVSDQWCNLFSGFFNAISPGVCP